MKKLLMTVAAGAALAMTASAASAQTLNQVKQRGVLQCGANTGLAGFGQPDAQGKLDRHGRRLIAARSLRRSSTIPPR